MHSHLAPRPLLAALFAGALLLGAAGCGDDDEPAATGDGGTTTTADDSTEVPDYGGTTGGTDGDAAAGTIVAADFSLTDLTVAPGEAIVLQNDGEQAHTATSDDEGLFGLEAEGGATSDPGTAPTEPGTYTFHCEIHNAMTATLTVEE
jgi:plastocyanin